jgi:hypothetical protein
MPPYTTLGVWNVGLTTIIVNREFLGNDTSVRLGQRADMSEKEKSRRYTRVGLPKGMLVAWEYSGIRKTSRVGVLAVGGLFIITPDPPPNGDTIRLMFEVPGGEVRARAIVRDSQRNKGMGVEFTSMGQEARALLNRLMKILDRI